MGLADDMGVGEVVVRLTVEISPKDSDFLQALADYRNALAKLQTQGSSRARLRRKRTRKVEAEEAIAIQCASLREQLAGMFEACGPLPTPPDPDASDAEEARYKKAMENYASRVLAWDRRNS